MAGSWQYDLVKGISRLICLLPYRAVLFLGRGTGRLYYRVAKRQRQRAIVQAKDSLGLTDKEAERLIRRLFMNLATSFMEMLYLPALNSENIRRYITIEGLENLRQAVEAGRGVVLLTVHMGNWEWLGTALAHAGFPMTTIALPQPHPQLNRLLNEYRAMSGLEVYSMGTNDMFKVVRALRKGKVLGFLADQDPGRDGVFVDFLGKKASTSPTPAHLAIKYQAQIVPAFIFRSPDGGHRVVVEPAVSAEQSVDAEQELYQITVKTTKTVEEMIKAHPDEWLWFQNRWKTPCDEN